MFGMKVFTSDPLDGVTLPPIQEILGDTLINLLNVFPNSDAGL